MNSEHDKIKVWFANQNSQPHEIESRINLTIVMNLTMSKSLSNKYGQKLFGSAKKSATHAIKTASKKAIQKSAEATGYLTGNEIADKITSVSKKPAMELHSKELPNNNNNNNEDIEITDNKKRYRSPKERKQIIDKLRLVPRKDAYF